MSIHSKARRNAGKRRARTAGETEAAPIEPHADLRDRQGELLGGIVRREGEWTLGLGGKIVGDTHSAARALAILRRAAALHEREGTQVRLSCSATLRRAAEREAAEQGLSFEQFERRLAEEMAAAAANRH
ncbi:hypothetical protein [Vulcaniibacterium tengchongense]|uniref:Uncharacterized protein n=1 Tax=Vulcaniibacterium tengchongense TaxID=1273429 RepID=A0A3N4VPK3_9GAMM|nr:hypothetical protein [Vulcaniibacterium tengchongense]RPE81809.1 hypothetical protein EDC50_1011 [Vulcaniibacterium tengchongense]